MSWGIYIELHDPARQPRHQLKLFRSRTMTEILTWKFVLPLELVSGLHELMRQVKEELHPEHVDLDIWENVGECLRLVCRCEVRARREPLSKLSTLLAVAAHDAAPDPTCVVTGSPCVTIVASTSTRVDYTCLEKQADLRIREMLAAADALMLLHVKTRASGLFVWEWIELCLRSIFEVRRRLQGVLAARA